MRSLLYYGFLRAIAQVKERNNLTMLLCTQVYTFQESTTMEIQSVGIKEFRANLYKYTQQTSEPIVVTSHGVSIGYYIPTQPTPQKQDLLALQEAVQKITQLLQTQGISEDELFDDFQQERRSNPQ